MKKTAAILLLLLFLFNTIGYRLFILYAEDEADEFFSSRLDNGYYSDDDLVTVKVPINLPYQTNWNNYERVNGQVKLNGQLYNYVKRKIYNDTMIYLCIRHDSKAIIEQKANDYLGKVNDVPANDNTKKTDAFKQFFSDYNTHSALKISFFINTVNSYNLYLTKYLPELHIISPDQPPQSIA